MVVAPGPYTFPFSLTEAVPPSLEIVTCKLKLSHAITFSLHSTWSVFPTNLMMSHFCLSGFLLSWDQTPVLPYGPLSSAWPDLCSSDFISALSVLPMGSVPSKSLIFAILFPCPGMLPTTPSSPSYSLQTSRKTYLYSFSLLSCSEHPHLCHTNPFPLWSFSRGQVCMYSWGYLLIASPPTQSMITQYGLWKIYLLLECCSALCTSYSLRDLVEMFASLILSIRVSWT